MVTEPAFSTQLSRVLVAFTVEFDNEFEHRMPHRTTMAGRSAARPAGMEPYPDGWRAAVRQPTTLPHHPTVLHRGGFPDGS